MTEPTDNTFDPAKFDDEFARIFDEKIAMQKGTLPGQYAVPGQRSSAMHQTLNEVARLTGQLQARHEENAQLASEVLRLRSVVRDRERMIWFAIATWLVLLAMVLVNRA